MKKHVLIGLGLMIFCFIAGGIYIATSTKKVIHKLENVAAFHQVKFLRNTLEQNIKTVQTELLLQGSPHSSPLDSTARKIEAMEGSAAICRTCHHSIETTKRLENFGKALGLYVELLSRTLKMPATNEHLENARMQAFSQGEVLLKDVKALSTDSAGKIAERISSIQGDITATNHFLWTCLVLGPATIIIITAFFLKRFTGAVDTLVDATQSLEQGNLDFRISKPMKGEFHTLAQAFNRMVDAINEERQKFESVYKTYQTLFETAGDAIMITGIDQDNKGQIIFANKAASELYGYTIDELLGLNIATLVPEDKQQRFLAHLETVLAGEWSHKRVKRQKKDGTLIHIDLSMGLLQLGERRYLLSFCRDITEQLRAEEELHRANQMALVGQMSAGLAHEIKNPLAGIKLSLDVLADDLNLQPEDKELFARIVNEVGRLEKLLKNLLNYARPPKPQFDQVDMNQLLDNALGNVEVTARSKGLLNIRFVKDYATYLPRIEVDSAQMQQVFLNILFNATDAINADGTITISTGMANEADFWLKISDNGKGMSEEDLKKMFTPFFTTKAKGMGLGLSICKSLIEQHGGRIEVKSQIGCGTSFHIALPLSQANRE